MDLVEEKVLKFLKTALGRKNLALDSLLTDSCKNEDDAFYLFLEFFEKFEIEKGNLYLDKYFYPQQSFWDIIRFKKAKYNYKPPISIRHMAAVAKTKEWFDPN